MADALLTVDQLRVDFQMDEGCVTAVNGVSFSIAPNRTLGVVGESGCGKSVTARAMMGLIPMPPGKIVSGRILYRKHGQEIDITKLPPKGREIRKIRGNDIAMIFQEPMTSLDPVYTIGNQMSEPLRLHQGLSKRAAKDRAITMLSAVGIPAPEKRINDYPFNLSGGMRQRVMIAMALSCHPALLIADEPTTALDVTIQAQVLELMQALRQEFHTAIMFITHDLGVIADMADEVIVMYLGKIVEHAGITEIFAHPRHPYTRGLLQSVPSLIKSKERLVPITGSIPSLLDMPQGCGFAPRCPQTMPICRKQVPPLTEVAPRHHSACWLDIQSTV